MKCRYSSNTRGITVSIVFEVSRDPQLLQQYYGLRERCFREELGLPEFDGSEEEQDRRGQILIGHSNGQCVAGVRINSQVPQLGPIRELGILPGNCCTWERLVLEPSARSVQLFHDVCASLVSKSRASGYGHALVLSSLRNARFYRKCHSALGVAFQIHRPVPNHAQGAFAGLEHFLSVANLQSEIPVGLAA